MTHHSDPAARGDTSSPRQRTLGELALAHPGAIGVFRRCKLDFCCGGNVTLEAAAAKRGLDVAALEAELLALGVADAAAAPTDPLALIEHVVKRFHDTHRAELPELIRLATKVERVHAAHAAVPKGLAVLLLDIDAELRLHMQKEENILFPMMRESAAGMLAHPIARMRDEHSAHGLQLERLRELTQDMTPPEAACNSWRALYAGAAKFADDLVEHIHTENNVLFPRFEARG